MMHRTIGFAQRSCAHALVFLLIVIAVPAGADGIEGLDFDLPEYRSFWQYVLLLVNLDEVVETVGFYACLISVLVILIWLTVAMRQYVWTAYTALAAFGLVWIGLNDQNLSGIYWSGLEVQPRGLIALGHVMISANFVVAGLAIRSGHPLARAKWPLLTMAALSWAGWLYGTGRPELEGFVIFNALATLAGMSHGFAFATFTRLDGRPDRRILAGAAALLVCILAAAIAVTLGTIGQDVDIILVSRLIILAVTIFLVAFFVRRIYAIRRSREEAIARTIADARRESEMSRALLEEQRKHNEALEVARLQKMRLATASHDIRQPIMSLRTTMDALSHRQGPEVRAQLGTAFDYLDQLAASYSEEARGDAPIRPAEHSPEGEAFETGTETVSAMLLLQTLERMFAHEAEKQGMALVVDTHDINIIVQPLAMMRILSNLITNAIQHATGGEIRVQVNPDGDKVVFTVENLGQPPTEADFAAFAKGAASEGQGLGLAITRQLAENHGIGLTLRPSDGQVCFDVRVPAAA